MINDAPHYPIVGAEIRRELHILLSLLFAGEKIATMARQNWQFAFLSNDVLRPVLPFKFLTVAVAVRSELDRIRGDKRKDSDAIGNCGLDFADVTIKDAKPLSLRDACNRAIHAKRTLFHSEDEAAKNDFVTFNGKITLYGLEKKQHWKAVVDMEAFAAACLVALQDAP